MLLSAVIARRGCASAALLSALTGLWIHVLMYRRPALALLNSVFADAARRPANDVFALSRDTINELLAISVLGPLLSTDIRASYCPHVFCMDASPDGAGICQAATSSAVVRELWRHSEQRGFYTKLQNDAGALLEGLGIPSEPEFGAQPTFVHRDLFPLRPSLAEGVLFDCIELFSAGPNWSRAHSSAGLSVHPAVCGPGSVSQLFSVILRRTASFGSSARWPLGALCGSGTWGRRVFPSVPCGGLVYGPNSHLLGLSRRTVAPLGTLAWLAGLPFFSVLSPLAAGSSASSNPAAA